MSAIDSEATGTLDTLGRAVAHLEGAEQLAPLKERARGVQAEAADLASALRNVVETWEDDPERLAEVSSRRAKLSDLRRKYGATLEEVLRYAAKASERLVEIEESAGRAETARAEYSVAQADLESAESQVAAQRRTAAPQLASAVQSHLRKLAMPAARIEIVVGSEGAGDDVSFLLGANPGSRHCRSTRWLPVVSSPARCSQCDLLSLVEDPRSCSTRLTQESAGRPQTRSGGRSRPWR